MTIAYPLDQLRGEIAFIAYHLHWSFDEIAAFSHLDRIEWVRQVSSINERVMKSKE